MYQAHVAYMLIAEQLEKRLHVLANLITLVSHQIVVRNVLLIQTALKLKRVKNKNVAILVCQLVVSMHDAMFKTIDQFVSVMKDSKVIHIRDVKKFDVTSHH